MFKGFRVGCIIKFSADKFNETNGDCQIFQQNQHVPTAEIQWRQVDAKKSITKILIKKKAYNTQNKPMTLNK